MSNFKLGNDFEDFYEYHLDFRKGNKNGIMIKKSIEKYNSGGTSVLYIAELFHNGKSLTIGIGETVEEIEQEVNQFLENIKNFFQLEKTEEY